MEKLVIVAAIIIVSVVGLWELLVRFRLAKLIVKYLFGRKQ